MESLSSTNFEFYYNAERSAEDGVASISQGDITTVLISYIVMFLYMSVFLSTFRGLSTVLIDIRVSLGLCCILMIVMALTSSFGLFSFLGYKTSLVVLEVTPFLMLAVGSGDNFIFVKNFVSSLASLNEEKQQLSVERKVALNLRQIGPSLMLSSCAQIMAFGIGAIVPVAAVRMFALYSAFAVFIKFCLQITFFVAIFTIDTKRQLNNRYDILCCFGTKKPTKNANYEILFEKIFRKFYSPFLLHKYVRPVVIILFTAWFIASLAMVPRIKIGLNLQVIFPDESYTRKYLGAFEKYSAVGPPIYMVVKDGYQYDSIKYQNNICGTVSCDFQSLVNQITQATKQANVTYIETPPPSWIDDFFSWMSSSACCQINETSLEFCNNNDACVSCPTYDKPFDQRPFPSDFNKFILHFLQQNPDEICPKAGKALYSSSVEIRRMQNTSRIGATNFMAYSTVPRNVEDSYKSLQASRHLSDTFSKYLERASGFSSYDEGLNSVFFYSVVHVYYEQYIGIMNTTLLNLIYSIVGVFIVTLLLLGLDIQSSLTVLVILILTTGDLLGGMYMAGVDLNAISIVNMIMAIGIAVEFYVHMIRDFSVTIGNDKIKRAESVLNHIGVFIFVGVTIPELVSIATMSTAKSEMFRLYFFKMYLILIITCTLNGLVFLPVFLSYIGAPLNQSKLCILNKEFKLSTNANGKEDTSQLYELDDTLVKQMD